MKDMKVDVNSSLFYDGELSTKEELAELLLDEKASEHLNNYASITAALREENVDEARMAKMRENIFLAIENEEIDSVTTEVKAVAANEPLELSKKELFENKAKRFSSFSWNKMQTVVAASIAGICFIAAQWVFSPGSGDSFVEDSVINGSNIYMSPVSNSNYDTIHPKSNLQFNETKKTNYSSAEMQSIEEKKNKEIENLDALMNNYDLSKRVVTLEK